MGARHRRSPHRAAIVKQVPVVFLTPHSRADDRLPVQILDWDREIIKAIPIHRHPPHHHFGKRTIQVVLRLVWAVSIETVHFVINILRPVQHPHWSVVVVVVTAVVITIHHRWRLPLPRHDPFIPTMIVTMAQRMSPTNSICTTSHRKISPYKWTIRCWRSMRCVETVRATVQRIMNSNVKSVSDILLSRSSSEEHPIASRFTRRSRSETVDEYAQCRWYSDYSNSCSRSSTTVDTDLPIATLQSANEHESQWFIFGSRPTTEVDLWFERL